MLIAALELEFGSLDIDKDSLTYFDYHDNITVVGKNVYILDDTGQTEYRNAFNTDQNTLIIPVLDVAIKYKCPYKGTDVSLGIRNELYVTSTKTNFIPPLMMR